MSLFRRGRTWWINLHRDGVRYQFSTGTTKKKPAEAVLEKFKLELHAKAFGIPNYDQHITVSALFAHFVAKAKPSTYHTERIKQLLPFFGDIEAARLTRSLVAEYRDVRRSDSGVTDATVNRDLSVLRRVLNWSVDEQLIPANPLPRLKLVRERGINRPVMSVREEQQVLSAAPDYLRRIIITALDTGLRKGELLKQRWEDVDFDRNVLVVTRSKTPEGQGRELPLSGRVREVLLEIRKPAGLVFMFQSQPIADIKKGWAAALERGGVRHIRFHDLRHTFATRLAECGASVLPEVRMALLGHMPTNRVHSRYVHIEIGLKRAAIAQLEAWHKQQEELLKGETRGNKTHSTTNTADCRQDQQPKTMEAEIASGRNARPGGQNPAGSE